MTGVATCPGCRMPQLVKNDGSMRRHRNPFNRAEDCPGGGRWPPVVKQEDAA